MRAEPARTTSAPPSARGRSRSIDGENDGRDAGRNLLQRPVEAAVHAGEREQAAHGRQRERATARQRNGERGAHEPEEHGREREAQAGAAR